MVQGYWSTRDLNERFGWSRRTVFRRMKREENPFPQPRIKASGSHNLWAIDDVAEWEEREAGLTA